MPKAAVCTIYHNPRCSKSRATLALLQEQGIEPTVVEYLKHPPVAAEIKALLRKLGLKAEQLLRKGDESYQALAVENGWAGKELTETQWVDVLAKHPALIERPIVVLGDSAVLGRPPEQVLTLLNKRSKREAK
jgi:arsenate reductase